METGLGWELGRDGKHLSIPIRPHDAEVVREWCAAHCEGDFLLVLGRRIVFERRDDAAFATLYWRAEGD
jgi:hypothetical protein